MTNCEERVAALEERLEELENKQIMDMQMMERKYIQQHNRLMAVLSEILAIMTPVLATCAVSRTMRSLTQSARI